jgi:hypothetical protein
MSNNQGFSEQETKELRTALSGFVESHINPLRQWQEQKDKADVQNQKAIDDLLVRIKEGSAPTDHKLSFGSAFAKAIKDQFESKRAEIENFQHDRNAKFTIDLKSVGTMTTGNITGQGVANYSSNPTLYPSQKVNLRDVISTTHSDTGIYVGYKESGSEGGIDLQTEGQGKSQVDYDLTEVKNVSGYIAGFARFSKQMMKQLPWLTNTLPRLLLRDFYKKENRHFWDLIATKATGFNTTSETDDNKQLIDVLMGRLDQDYQNSFILCRHTAIGNILKLLYTNSNYAGAGAVLGTQSGQLTIAGTPVIGCTFIPSFDKVLVVDSDYIERVETESLRVEFSYEDSDNFQKNLVTARVECFEDLNIMRAEAISVADMGNSSTS